jgi:hypothetical protein
MPSLRLGRTEAVQHGRLTVIEVGEAELRLWPLRCLGFLLDVFAHSSRLQRDLVKAEAATAQVRKDGASTAGIELPTRYDEIEKLLRGNPM